MAAKEKSTSKSYSKAQILKSKQFTAIEKDFLQCMLEEEKKYTLEKVKDKLDQEKKREVK